MIRGDEGVIIGSMKCAVRSVREGGEKEKIQVK